MGEGPAKVRGSGGIAARGERFRSCGLAVENRQPETILLVEDDDAVRMITRRILTEAGYVVLEAAGGKAAVATCLDHSGTIDLLLTDVMIPEMNGRQVAEKVATARPEIKVMYMSGYDDDTISQCGVLDADIVLLEKPFTVSGILGKVGSVLNHGCEGGEQGAGRVSAIDR